MLLKQFHFSMIVQAGRFSALSSHSLLSESIQSEGFKDIYRTVVLHY